MLFRSGCISISLALQRPAANIAASDISEQALQIAQRNAQKHGVADRIHFAHGSALQPFLNDPELLDGIVETPVDEPGHVYHMYCVRSPDRDRLSAALTDYSDVFSPVFCSLIRAGESTGRLSEVLRSLVENIKWEDELAAQTKKIIM